SCSIHPNSLPLPRTPSARMASTPDSAMEHLGFRCVKDASPDAPAPQPAAAPVQPEQAKPQPPAPSPAPQPIAR
ncbi:MAG: hypothetical protein ACO3QC_12500, partial [Phycisphaerales bacterium]